mmetsp:Transcript_18986/g.35251  ORF Transcript_18986/g.35251 Transcript_18986/m.35251 type:complete len:202 (+) Transcript_18986:1736-2341(+)
MELDWLEEAVEDMLPASLFKLFSPLRSLPTLPLSCVAPLALFMDWLFLLPPSPPLPLPLPGERPKPSKFRSRALEALLPGVPPDPGGGGGGATLEGLLFGVGVGAGDLRPFDSGCIPPSPTKGTGLVLPLLLGMSISEIVLTICLGAITGEPVLCVCSRFSTKASTPTSMLPLLLALGGEPWPGVPSSLSLLPLSLRSARL